MNQGQAEAPSVGSRAKTIGALVLTVSIGILLYGIVTTGLGAL